MGEILVERFWSKVDKSPGKGPWGDCWEWQAALTPKGYGAFAASSDDVWFAHRMAYTLEVGPIAPGAVVRHRCDNRRCCNPRHLLTGAPADNSADMVERGRSLRGDRSPHAKLSEAEVVELRNLHRSGVRQVVLAQQFGVSKQLVNDLVKGRRRV